MQHQLVWRKASASGAQGDCVQIAATPEVILVRDSKDRNGPWLRVLPGEWAEFTERIQNGQFG